MCAPGRRQRGNAVSVYLRVPAYAAADGGWRRPGEPSFSHLRCHVLGPVRVRHRPELVEPLADCRKLLGALNIGPLKQGRELADGRTYGLSARRECRIEVAHRGQAGLHAVTDLCADAVDPNTIIG